MANRTIRISLKTIAFLFPEGSQERIYLHGKWQIERGRKPSLRYGNHHTPREAFVTVDQMLGKYFDEIRHQAYSRQAFFWHEDLIQEIGRRTPVSKLPLPLPYQQF